MKKTLLALAATLALSTGIIAAPATTTSPATTTAVGQEVASAAAAEIGWGFGLRVRPSAARAIYSATGGGNYWMMVPGSYGNDIMKFRAPNGYTAYWHYAGEDRTYKAKCIGGATTYHNCWVYLYGDAVISSVIRNR